MMNQKLLYTRNYYILRKINQEQKFIDFLNQDNELIELVDFSLNKLKDKLLWVIQEKNSFDNFESLIHNETELNQKLSAKFAENEIYNIVEDKSISANLFTNVFNKLCRRIFLKDGHNDEQYDLQSYIHYWLENNLAIKIAEDNRFSALSVLFKLLEQTEMLRYFYCDLIKSIPLEWVENELEKWIKSDENPNNVLDSIRTFDKEYFKGYESMLQKLNKSTPWNFIFESTRFSDYATFNNKFSFKSSVLIEKKLSLWIYFWDKLKLPLLQNIPFHNIQYPKDILNIAKELVKQKDKIKSNQSHLACILLNNLVGNSLKVTEALSFYDNDERIQSLTPFEKDEEIIENGEKAFNEWKEEKTKIYKEIINILSEILSYEAIEEWAFSYKPRSSPQNHFTDQYNVEVKNVIAAFFDYSNIKSFDKKIEEVEYNFNLQKFNFLVTQLNEETSTENQTKKLLNKLIDFILSDKFFWDKTYSQPYWDTLKGVGLLLSSINNSVSTSFDLINRIKVHYEGWNIKTGNYKLTKQESFMLCGIILLLEHNNAFKDKKERNSFFKQLLNLILCQIRFSPPSVIEDDYLKPLQLLYLVVNQIFPDLKLYYEKELVLNLDDLGSVLEILNSENYPLKPCSKKLLQKRIDNEFVYEMRKLKSYKNNKKSEFLENAIGKLGLKYE